MKKNFSVWMAVLLIGLFTIAITDASVFAMGGSPKKEIKVEDENQETTDMTDEASSQDEDSSYTDEESGESEDGMQNEESEEDSESDSAE